MNIPRNGSAFIVFKLISTADGFTPVSGRSGYDVRLSRGGGAFSEPEHEPTEIGYGWYSLLVTNDTEILGPLILVATDAAVRGDAVCQVIAI